MLFFWDTHIGLKHFGLQKHGRVGNPFTPLPTPVCFIFGQILTDTLRELTFLSCVCTSLWMCRLPMTPQTKCNYSFIPHENLDTTSALIDFFLSLDFCRAPGLAQRMCYMSKVRKRCCWVTECCWASSADSDVRWGAQCWMRGWSELNRRLRTPRVFYCADAAGDKSSTDPALTPGQTYLERMSDELCAQWLFRVAQSVYTAQLFMILATGKWDWLPVNERTSFNSEY